MLDETHREIAKEIARTLNLGREETLLLEEGSVMPDSWENFPHHKDKELDIANNILEAIKLYSEDDDECFIKLGIALHYIQDMWTLRPRIRDEHTRYEQTIDSIMRARKAKVERFQKTITIPPEEAQLREAIKMMILPTKTKGAYLTFLNKVLDGVKGIKRPYMKAIRKVEREMSSRAEKSLSAWIKHHREKDDKDWDYYHKRREEARRLLKSDKRIKRIVTYALLERPSPYSKPLLDLSYAYLVSLEVARNVLSAAK